MTPYSAPASAHVVVAVPARDEADRIRACLGGLARQHGAPPFVVLLLLNDCTDATAERVAALAPALPYAVHAMEVRLPLALAHAGGARATAMREASALLAPDGVLLSTDADSVAPRDWLSSNLAALARGVDAVAGRAVIDPGEAALIPSALHEADARECAYAATLDEMASVIDPDPRDPWPRHTEESGASIAVTQTAWARVGGMEPVPLGEDRAFFDRLRRYDLGIRHAPEISVRVSGRIEGRAVGGMADTIRRRMHAPDPFVDDRLEPAMDAARRARLRRAARSAWCAGTIPPGFAAALGMPAARLDELMRGSLFGVAWASIEAEASSLARRPVPTIALAEQTQMARIFLRRLRASAESVGAGSLSAAVAPHPDDSADVAPV